MITINLPNLPLDTLLVWILVGLVAGFLATHVMLGHGLGILTDVVVGVLGAMVGGYLANYFQVHLTIVGHPVISEMIVAFVGALVLLLLVRIIGAGSSAGRRSF
jgi:uncharacterized membrane protein YeaQ/YmgE (transglycosylase-associated protein family)